MSGGAGSFVEWTNRGIHLAEGAAHRVPLGGAAGRLAQRLPHLGLVVGGTQAGFFFTEAVDAFSTQGGDSSDAWEAVLSKLYPIRSHTGAAQGGISAALSLTPWGTSLALAEIATDWAGSVSRSSGRRGYSANKAVGGFVRGTLGRGRNSLIDTRGVHRIFGGGMLGTTAEGVVSVVYSPLNTAATIVCGLCDLNANAIKGSSAGQR